MPTQRQQKLGETLQRRRLNPPLNPADRVLTGPGPQGEPALAETLLRARVAEGSGHL